MQKKETSKIELDKQRIKIKKIKEKYKKERRGLQKELKRKEEEKKCLVEDFQLPLEGTRELRLIGELTELIRDLEKAMDGLEEQRREKTAKFLEKCEDLHKEIAKSEKQIQKQRHELDNKKGELKAKRSKRRVVYGMMLTIILADGNNMLVTAKELKDTLVESISLFRVEESEQEEPMDEDIAPEKEENKTNQLWDLVNDLREHMDYNFILEDGQLNKVMNDEIEDIISLSGYPQNEMGYEQFLADCRAGNIKEILPGASYDRESDLDGLLNEIAEDLEIPFLDKISRGKMIGTQIEWEQSAPRSTELENIINKRRQALGMEESIPMRRTIYFLLANDYQRLGMECLIQGKDDTDVYYYYGMSIYCCYCALGYERTDEKHSDEMILNYARARYKDIVDNVETEILAEELDDLDQIYSLLNKQL